jgi:hypothetical protein
LWFLAVTLVSSIIAVPAYALLGGTPWVWSTRIGVGFAGAAVGSFAGVMLAGLAGLHRFGGFLVAVIIATIVSVALQRKAHRGEFDWSDFI